MHKCDFCGSLFGDRICYFCDKTCCTNCMTDDRTRCKECYIKKRRLGWKKLLKRNKVVLIFVGLLWLYAVFPGPFFPEIAIDVQGVQHCFTSNGAIIFARFLFLRLERKRVLQHGQR